MRIAVIAHNLRVGGGLSVGRNVATSLRRVGDEHEYLLIVPAGVGYEKLQFPTKSQVVFRKQFLRWIGLWWFEKVTLPRMVHAFRPDVVWSLGNFGLRNPGAPQAFLYHMPQPLYDKKHRRGEPWRETLQICLFNRRLLRSLPATQMVFCQTQTASNRFRRTFGYNGKIEIMPNAVSQLVDDRRQPTPAVFAQLKGKTVLFCLTKYYVQKNLNSFVEMFRRHREKLSDVAILVTVAAEQHPQAPRFLQSIETTGLQEQIINVGPLPQEQIAAYYQNCQALILPTVLESFTSTYPEAMKFDCPILTSDLDFAREVCGDAAIYFDPWNVDSMCDAIVRLRDNPPLAKELKEHGRERFKQIACSWDDIVSSALQTVTGLANSKQPELTATLGETR